MTRALYTPLPIAIGPLTFTPSRPIEVELIGYEGDRARIRQPTGAGSMIAIRARARGESYPPTVVRLVARSCVREIEP